MLDLLSLLTYFHYCRGSLILHLCGKSLTIRRLQLLLTSKIAQNRNLFTVAQLGLQSPHEIWVHLCRPTWKSKWTKIKKRLGWTGLEQGKLRKLELKLTSATMTLTFTFGGKSRLGWKHLTMATSRWMVARRSLLWMTDRQTAKKSQNDGIHNINWRIVMLQSLTYLWNQILFLIILMLLFFYYFMYIQFVHILIAYFQIHSGGAQRENVKSCIIVQILLEPILYLHPQYSSFVTDDSIMHYIAIPTHPTIKQVFIHLVLPQLKWQDPEKVLRGWSKFPQ